MVMLTYASYIICIENDGIQSIPRLMMAYGFNML